MTGWLSELQRQYNMFVFRYDKIPQGIWMETNRGTMVLHTVPNAYVNKANFVYDVNQAMGRSNLMLPILPNMESQILTPFGDQQYYLMGWPAAESEWIDYGWLGSSLARFHHISVELLKNFHCKFSDFGKWPKLWKAKYNLIQKCEQIAIARMGTDEEDPFDTYFIENAGYFNKIGAMSLAYLQTCNYKQVCRSTAEFGRLSYINFGYDKFVTTPEGRIFFADPFSLVEDIRVRDLAQFIKADVREYGWNPQNIYSFLYSYHTVCPLTPEEFTLMYALILLPGRIIKKIEYLYNRPSLFQPENSSLELFRDETKGISARDAYLEMKRTEVLITEFPRFVKQSFGVEIHRI